jgi:hypothetical protein
MSVYDDQIPEIDLTWGAAWKIGVTVTLFPVLVLVIGFILFGLLVLS